MNRQVSIVAITAALALSSLAVSALAQEKKPDRNVYFGEEHLHTGHAVTTRCR